MTKSKFILPVLAFIATIACYGQKTDKLQTMMDGRQKKQENSLGIHRQNIPRVLTGIDILQWNNFDVLQGKRVGLITNPSGIDSKLRSTIDILFDSKHTNLLALYAPEHGIRGEVYAGEKVATNTDTQTRLPIYSLYGKTRKPTSAMLNDIDILVYDIQDIGCRSFTFISTLYLAMQAAAENNKEFVVLDRPNPIGGLRVEGNYVNDGYYSFVSQMRIPYIYGLTVGELATFINSELLSDNPCKLHVVKMEGWRRDMTWDETGLPWVPASPHIPSPEAALLYPATGILGELGIVSIGVGYTLPFQIIGAPWINGEQLASQLSKHPIEGVSFRPITYKPFYSTFSGKKCEGVEIYIADKATTPLMEIQFVVMQALHELYPGQMSFASVASDRLHMFDLVCGTNYYRENLNKNFQWSNVREFFTKDAEEWRKISAQYQLYK